MRYRSILYRFTRASAKSSCVSPGRPFMELEKLRFKFNLSYTLVCHVLTTKITISFSSLVLGGSFSVGRKTFLS